MNNENNKLFYVSDPRMFDLIREKRNSLLKETDWTQAPDIKMPEETKKEWLNYRQLLRDFPLNFTSDINEGVFWNQIIEWPQIPGENKQQKVLSDTNNPIIL